MKAIFVVLVNCSDPAREEVFNDWYNNVHIPDVLSCDGFVRCSRYELSTVPGDREARYLTIYEVAAEDPEGAVSDLRSAGRRWRAEGRIIDCLKAESAVLYKQIYP